MDVLEKVRLNDGVVFGYGERGKALYQSIHKICPLVDLVFCDNNKYIQKDLIDNENVFLPAEAVKLYRKRCFLLPSPAFATEMREQLLREGVSENNIVSEIPDELFENLYQKKRESRLQKRDYLRLEVNIVKHCNVNCKGCDHFAPLTKGEFMNVKNFERDMTRIAELFGKDNREIFILGGEPLLHPEICRFLEIARELFPDALLHIDTNGVLLGRMDDAFWETCNKLRVDIKVTIYPLGLDFDSLRNMAKEKNVDLQLLQKIEPGGYHRLWKAPLDVEGRQDALESFINCGQANRCITLENGRLFTCATGANMRLFNEAFPNSALKLTDEDGIDIYEAADKEEIYEYLSRPMPACKYCDVKNRKFGLPWEVSTKCIEEWT